MAKQTLNTLKNWFRTGLKPTQTQFWDWIDSFFHKDDNIPSSQVEGLQGLLDAKVDKKDLTSNKGVWDPDKAYVFDANQAQYVSFVNPDSTDDFFTTERWFRLDADTTAGQSPETHPEKWVHIGEVLGDVAIEDVLGLQNELDKKLSDAPQDGKSYLRKDGSWVELPQQAAGLASTWEVDAAAIRALTEHSGGMDVGNYATGAVYEFDAAVTATDDGDVYLRPDDVDAGSAGRWVKTKVFSVSGHVHNLSDVTPAAGNAGKMIIVDENGNVLGYSPYTFDQVFQTSALDVSDIDVGESKFPLITKQSDGTGALTGSVKQLDKIAPPSVADFLNPDNPNWVGDVLTITDVDNSNGAYGRNGQEFYGEEDWFACTSHNDTGATWKRNRGQDCLVVGNTVDDLIIAALETEAGWNSIANFKQLSTKSKMGSWFRRSTGGYFYACIDENNGWIRVGSPPTSVREITSASHPTLTSNLATHDFSTGFYDESVDGANETAKQGQEFWDTTNGAWFKRNKDGFWAKIN